MQHVCGANPARNESLKVMGAMRERAETTIETTQHILGAATVGILGPVAAELPNVRSMRRNIQRRRNGANHVLPVPATRAALPNPLPQQFSTTNGGAQFLLWDSGDQDRILMFVTQEKMRVLEDNDHWFVDGTFDAAPLIYGQLFTVHALLDGVLIPCVYVLLPDKTQVTYTRMFRELINLHANLHPSTVLCDFEVAIKNALEAVFPGVTVKGCYFHLTKNIWRRIQAEGLQDRYEQDPAFVEEVRMIAALAFVPPNDVDRYFNIISQNIDQALEVILDYFETNYIGHMQRQRFRRPRFPYAWWGVHDRVLDNLPRTNNGVEGWHNRFNQHVGQHHANIWRLFGVMKSDEDISSVELVHLRQGRPLKNPNPVYARVNRRITTVVASYANRQPLEYLRGIAHNIKV